MIMGDDRSDEHLKIFKCLVDTGADVFRSALERKVCNNNVITFEQYLDNVKHQFYHQVEKNRNKQCCSQSPHVNCNVNGYMDKKIFNKVYNKKTEEDTHQCLDRFEVKAGISTDELDLSDLNFFLWNSNMLSQQEKQSLQTIMTIRSYICHPESTHCYSITELENVWLSLENDILLFAEPYRYKKMVTLQIATLKKYKVNEIESERIINEMYTESKKITRELKLEVQSRNDDIKHLVKEETVGLKNCINDTYDKTQLYINDQVQEITENIAKHHQVLATRCTEEIQNTVAQESSYTRLHSEDQRHAIDTKLTESEHRVCQTVIQSRGRLEDKLIEQQNETRKHTVELNEDQMEEKRKLIAEVLKMKTDIKEMKTDMKEMKTMFIGYVVKQRVDLVMSTEQIEKSTKSPDNRKVDITVKVNQTNVTEDKENKIIENLPPEIEILTNNDSSPEAAVTETIEITGKKVNSIILELKATPGILHSVETFKEAMLTLVKNVQTAGGIDVDIEDTVTVNLWFESPLTEDQIAVVECLFAQEWNDDNNTKQVSTEYSSTPDENLSTGGVKDMELRPELDTYSQKETSEGVPPETIEPLSKTVCQFCDDKNKIIKALKEQHEKDKILNNQYKWSMPRLQKENSNLKGLQKEKNRLDYVVTDLQEKNNQLEDVVIGLQKENSNLKGLQKEKNRLDYVVTGLQKEKNRLDYVVTGLQEENIQLENVVTGLQKENSNLKDLQGKNNQLEDLVIGLQEVNSNLKDLQEKNNQLEDVVIGLQKENSNLKALLRPENTGMISVTEKLRMKQKEVKSDDLSSLEPEQKYYVRKEDNRLTDSSSKTTLYECRHCYEKNEIIIQLDRRLCEIRRRIMEAKGKSLSGNNLFEDLLTITHQNTSMTSVEDKGRMKDKELKSDISSQISELIYESDVRNPETKAKLNLMELQHSKVPGAGLVQPEDNSELSLRISELRREYARNSYTKIEEQKGLAVILHRDFSPLIDSGIPYIQEFFEEMGFVVKGMVDSVFSQLYKYMADEKFYCIFILFADYVDFEHIHLLHACLSVRVQGKPIIVMINSTTRSYETRTITKEPDTLVVSPFDLYRDLFRGGYNIFDDFMKVTLSNRFADIMDILTRMNALHAFPVITFKSTLRKKFCFL